MKTKPPGALGQLEPLAAQLAAITGADKIKLNKPAMLIFAGDHGIADEGVSIAPPEVTQQMVRNFIHGGAAINCFCQVAGISLHIIDAGIRHPVSSPRIINRSLGPGTRNIAVAPAMSRKSAEEGLEAGAEVARQRLENGSNILAFGEMGIGNTSSASALLSALSGQRASATCGRGTGIDDDTYRKKMVLIEQAIARHQADTKTVPQDLVGTLASLGGFEIVQMTGAMLAAAERQAIVLVDGFIASVAALVAVRMAPEARGYMVFCHQSEEQAHRLILEELNASPLLKLDLRLGEGTGAALAFPLLQAAQSFYNYMSSFDSAGVTSV